MSALLEARRMVATATFSEWYRQCYVLADLVRAGEVQRHEAIDCAAEIAAAHNLSQTDQYIADAFKPEVPSTFMVVPRPTYDEVA